MNKIKQFLTLGVFSLVVLALPSVASAQWGGNGPYGNNGYYGDIKGNLENLKRNAERFEKTSNRVNDRSNGRWGNNTERIEDLADDFKKATNKLVKDYGKGRNLDNSRDTARRVLDLGNRIDQAIYNSRGNGQLQNEWNMMRHDLNAVAQTYGYNNNGWGNRNQYPNNRYPGRNRNRNGNGDWRNRVPFPLPF